MPDNPKQILSEQGFIKLESLFSNHEIDELRLKSEAVLYRTSKAHRDRFESNGSLCNLAELPEYASLISDSRIIQAIQHLGGNDVRWTSGYLISKPPGGAPLFWHQDWWGWDSPISYQQSAAQLFVMIYLTDTTVDNGCLRVIPGSHRHWHSLHELPAAHTKDIATNIDLDSPIYSSHKDELALSVSRGDVLIGDSRLLHSAYANQSDAERPLLTLWYIPNWQTLPANVQATMQHIYERKVVDIDDAEQTLPTCADWPEYAFNKITRLVPDYKGSTAALEWNRIPDKAQLQPQDCNDVNA